MTNEIKEKSIRCIEWKLKNPMILLQYDSVFSDPFTVQNRICNLEFGEMNYALYLNSKGKLQTPVKVTVHTISNGQYVFSETKLVRNEHEFILTCDLYAYNCKDFIIFEVIIYTISPKDEGAIKQKKESLDTKADVHFQALSRDFAKLLSDNSSCDIEITCEGKKFNTHRIVLGARSPVLSAMLKSKMVEDKTGLIKIEDIKASIFECFLHYLYSGTLPKLNVDTAKQFYDVGDRYDVKDLKTACSDFLIKNLSEANACEILVLADQHSDTTFQNDVISYIVDKKVPKRDSQWSNFCERYPFLAIKVQNLFIQKYCPE